MIQINLLPVREIKRRNKAKNELLMGLLLIGLFIAALVCAGLYQWMQVRGLRTDLADRQAEKASLQDKLKKVQELEKERDMLLTRIKVIDNLKKASGLPVHVLDEIALRTPPDRIWLNKLTQNATSVQIEGMAQDNQTVAKFMKDLNESDYLSGATLAKVDMKKHADHDLKAFALNSSIKNPEPEKKNSAQGNAK